MRKDVKESIKILIILSMFIGGLFGIFCYDKRKIDSHLTRCRKLCYPALVIEEFSRKQCMCQPIILDKEEE